MGFLDKVLRSKVGTALRGTFFRPSDILGKGLGRSIALSLNKNEQRLLEKTRFDTRNLLFKQLHDARTRGDSDAFERLRRVAESTNNKTIASEILVGAPSNKEVIAAAGELALSATLATKFTAANAQTGQLFKSSRKLRGVKQAGRTSLKRALTVGTAREAAKGGIFGGLAAAQFDADTGDIAKSAGIGAAFGGLLNVASVGVSAGLRGAKKNLPGLLDRTEQRLKEVLSPEQVKRSNDVIGEINGSIPKRTNRIKRAFASKGLKTIRQARELPGRFIDKYHALRRVEDKLLDAKGRPLLDTEAVWKDSRLLNSKSQAMADDVILGLDDNLSRIANEADLDDDIVNAYLKNSDLRGRAGLGQKVEGGLNIKQLDDQFDRLWTNSTEKQRAGLEQVRETIRAYHHKMLGMRVDSGLISKGSMDAMLKEYPDYIPHNVIFDADDKIFEGLGRTLNVNQTDIKRAIGSVRDIEAPLDAIRARSVLTTRAVQKNKLMQNLAGIADENADLIPGMEKLGNKMKAKTGMESVSFFRDGQKVRYQVPRDIALAVKSNDDIWSSNTWRFMTAPNRALKKFSTQHNISFTIPNFFRDRQTAAVTASAYVEEYAKRYGSKAITNSADDIQKLYVRSGGYGASVFKDGDLDVIGKMQKHGIADHIPDAVNPVKVIDTINDAVEQSTRMSVFKQALAKGLDPETAALVSRDATIDFAKMGRWMQPLNDAVPFLNARVQGFANMVKAVETNPEMFSRMMFQTTVYPTMKLQQHNRRFESYKNISQYFKSKYWVVMVGEVDTNDSYTGDPIKVPQFITIPKGEAQQLVSGPLQAAMDKADGLDYRKNTKVLSDMFMDMSPVEFRSFSSSSDTGTSPTLLRFISNFGPIANIGVGLATNKDPFSGRDVVPSSRIDAPKDKQFRKTTPQVTKDLANKMGIAPSRLEFFINSFGGVPQDSQRVVDLAFGLVRGEELIDEEVETLGGEPESQLTTLPLTRRFFREAAEFYGPESAVRKEQVGRIRRTLRGQQLDTFDTAEEIWTRVNKAETQEEKTNVLARQADDLTPQVMKRIEYLSKSRQSLDALSKNMDVKTRAFVILQRVLEFKESGNSQEELGEYLSELRRKKILSDDVMKAMVLYQKLGITSPEDLTK